MNNLQRIHQIVEHHQYQTWEFPEGELLVDAQTAHLLVTVYRAPSQRNQEKFARMLESWPGLVRLMNFCWKQVQ